MSGMDVLLHSTMDCPLSSVLCSASLSMGFRFVVMTSVFMYSFNECLLSSYSTLGTRDKVVKEKETLAFVELKFERRE